MKTGCRRFWYAVVGLVLLSLSIFGWVEKGALSSKYSSTILWEMPGWALPRLLSPQPRVEKLYRDCGHREELPWPSGIEWRWVGEKELEVVFPPKDGWSIRREKSGRLVISQEVSGLCPADAPKRHLAELEGRVAVYQGPAGSSGKLDRVLELKFSALPPQWQERIRKGQAEFQSEQELRQALDSLDEYYSADAR